MNSIHPGLTRCPMMHRIASTQSLAAILLAFSTACPTAAEVEDLDLERPILPWNPGAGPTLHRVVFETDRFIAVGADGTIAVSTDGIQWELRDSGTRANFRAAVHGPDEWWIVGDNGIILHSPDSVRWTHLESPIRESLIDLVYSRCQFIAVGTSGTIMTSEDGRTWTRRKSGVSTEIRRVVDVGPFFLAGGAIQTLLRSNDGVRWFPYLTGRSTGVRDLVASEGRLLALGCCGGGVFLSLPDQPWQTSPIPGRPTLNGAATAVGHMVVVGSNGTILSAASGGRDPLWQPAASGTSRALYGVAQGRGRWVAVGSGGTLLVSNDGRIWRSARGSLDSP